jgi:Methyltransferase domain
MATETATGQETLIEQQQTCPICGSRDLDPLDVANMNSREPARRDRLAEVLGGDFFVQQKISYCRGCGHVFQSTRPTGPALQRIYDRFATAVGKVTPTDDNMVEYFLRHNAKDYVDMNAKTLAFLDELGVVDGATSALEVRTYGGGLPAMLRERGVGYVEAGYLQEFDAAMARRMFGIENLTPFAFTRPIDEFTPARERYDLIVAYEALTHSPDPMAFLHWVRDHLSENGTAVLLYEPNTPAYRQYQPLSVVFNNFHMNLLNEATSRQLVAHAGGLSVDVHQSRHRDYVAPLYLDLVVRHGGAASGPPENPYDAGYYRSWIAADASPRKRKVTELKRRLTRVMQPVKLGASREFGDLVPARLRRGG